MEETLLTAITGLPNFAFAALTIYWMSKRLDRLIDLSERLIEKCFETHGSADPTKTP
jgi:hypothetical protein